jgi:hypothetical protein
MAQKETLDYVKIFAPSGKGGKDLRIYMEKILLKKSPRMQEDNAADMFFSCNKGLWTLFHLQVCNVTSKQEMVAMVVIEVLVPMVMISLSKAH